MPNTQNENETQKAWYQKGHGKVIAIIAGTLVAVGGAYGATALADGKVYAHYKLHSSDEARGGGHGGKWHRGGRRGGHYGHFANMTDAEIEAKIVRMVKHVAIEIDATENQQVKITALVTAVAKDLKPLRAQMHEAGQEIHDVLLADTIDRDALERVRAERLAEADRVSKNLIVAVADVAEVLTPEQRKVLDKRIKQFPSMRRGWHRQ